MSSNNSKIISRLSHCLVDLNLDRHLSADQIVQWYERFVPPRPLGYLPLITGLLDEERTQRSEELEQLIALLFELHRRHDAGEEDGPPPDDRASIEALLKDHQLPPLEWGYHYQEALDRIEDGDLFGAVEAFEETFQQLLLAETTWPEIYQLYYNAGVAHLATGEELLGVNCLEIALELNPNFAAAKKTLDRHADSGFFPAVQSGLFKQMTQLLCDTFVPDIQELHRELATMSEKEICDRLAGVGIEVDRDRFVELAQKYADPGDIVDLILEQYPERVREESGTLLHAAVLRLWEIYCPSEPNTLLIADTLDEVAEFIESSALFEEPLAEDTRTRLFYDSMEEVLTVDKPGFLQGWRDSAGYAIVEHQSLVHILSTFATVAALRPRIRGLLGLLMREIPHPDWEALRIVCQYHDGDSDWKAAYRALSDADPTTCSYSLELGRVLVKNENWEAAVEVLKDAVEHIERGQRKVSAVDDDQWTEPSILDSYELVLDKLDRCYEHLEMTEEEKQWLDAKWEDLSTRSKAEYAQTPPDIDEDLVEELTEAFIKQQLDSSTDSYATEYYSFLSRFEIDFSTPPA